MKTLLLPPNHYDHDGQPNRVIMLRERRAFRTEPHRETYVKKTQDIWLLGPPQCGKSSAIDRLWLHRSQIWLKWPVLFVRGNDPLSRWCDQEALHGMALDQGRRYEALSVEKRIDALIEWAQTHPCVWIIDDAQDIGARKLTIAVRLLRHARVVVIGALSEQSLHPSLRLLLQRRAPQVLSMSSEAPFDATLSLMWVVLLLAMSAGWWSWPPRSAPCALWGAGLCRPVRGESCAGSRTP